MLQTIIKEITGTKQNSFLKTKLSFTNGGESPKIMSAKMEETKIEYHS